MSLVLCTLVYRRFGGLYTFAVVVRYGGLLINYSSTNNTTKKINKMNPKRLVCSVKVALSDTHVVWARETRHKQRSDNNNGGVPRWTRLSKVVLLNN